MDEPNDVNGQPTPTNTDSESESDLSEDEVDLTDEEGQTGNNEKEDVEAGDSSSSSALEDDEEEETGNITSGESSSDNGLTDKCCICLQKLNGQEIGVPDECDHRFCRVCLMEWAKTSQTCPMDRKPFNSILVTLDVDTILRVEELPARTWNALPPPSDDITQCEVCGLGDREDRLLLCDECNFAYHLECLDPPLDEVPFDDWFCPNCTREQGGTLRDPDAVPRQITFPEPASIETRLLTRRIRQRRQISRKRTVRKKRTTKKRKRKSTTAKSKTKSKTTKSSTKKRKTRKVKRRTKKKRRPRLVVQEKPSTSRDRIAHQLGIVPPKPGQVYVGLPLCRSTAHASTSSTSTESLSHQRFRAGISTLRIYSHHDDLADCIENESDEDILDLSSVATLRPQAHRRIFHQPSKFSSAVGVGFNDSQSSSVNILSEIMNSQQILLHDRNFRIGRDGVLIPSAELPHSSQGNNRRVRLERIAKHIYFEGITKQGNSLYTLTAPSTAIRQAPLNNSESPANFSQFRKLNNSNSGYGDSGGTSSSRSEPSDEANRVSHSQGEDGGRNHPGCPNDLNRANELIYDTIRRSTDSVEDKNKEKENKNKTPQKEEEEEDYNIYSDIEEEPQRDLNCEEENAPILPITSDPCLEKIHDSDNEHDMIIDEGVSGTTRLNEREARTSIESEEGNNNQQNAGEMVPLPPTIESDDSTNPAMPEADSPESIPLPDSTPPPSVPMTPSEDEAAIDEIQGGSVLYSPSDDDESGRQEYDPSQPLTSSDEDETGKKAQESAKAGPVEDKEKIIDEAIQNSALDLNSIPIPPDEYKRPTIQFSIPTRHKLIPISSLIKRQKGVLKKESAGAPASNYQTEISKAFGVDKDDEADGADEGDAGESEQMNVEKTSLVAKIFGSDDEEENKEANADENAEKTPHKISANTPDKNSSVTGSALENSDKWKKVEVEAPSESVIKVTETSNDNNLSPVVAVANDTVSHAREIVTKDDKAEGEPNTTNRTVNHIRSDDSSGRPAISFLELISDDSDDEVTIISEPKRKPRQDDKSNQDIIILSTRKSSPPSEKRSLKKAKEDNKDRLSGKEKEGSDKPSRRDKEDKNSRPLKRRRSSSISNYEEGEIPPFDKKKKKGKKSKKVKKRKRSKESHSSPRINFAERQAPDLEQEADSSGADDDGNKVSWRKPSRSTKERNYRDGKPKTEEKYFREKEKPESREHIERQSNREKSPYHRSKLSEKDRRASKADSRRAHRKSVSRGKSPSDSPARFSKSRSISRGRFKTKRVRNRSRSPSSRKSFSPRPRSRHYAGHPISTRKERSRSRSPGRMRSRSPNFDRHRGRRRSRSINRSRFNPGRSGREASSSASRSGSRSKFKKHEKNLVDKGKKASARKEKDRMVKETSNNAVPEEEVKEKEKEKKKKKRRKEKSVSPAKAVFADGDSIVVSLNFQKPNKEVVTKEPPDQTSDGKLEDEPTEKKKKRSSGRDSTTHSKPKPLKKTILIDLETSPIQEQKIGDSPTLVVLSDDEEERGLSNSSSRTKGKDGYQGDKSQDNVTTSGGSAIDESSSSPSFQHSKAMQADSTQIHQNDETSKLNESIFGHGKENGVNSPAKGDSIVTSTRDSIEGIGLTEETTGSRSNSPKPPEAQTTQTQPPLSTPPLPLTESPLTRQVDGTSKYDNFRGIPTSNNASSSNSIVPPLPSLSNNLGQGLTRPLGIGNIPGLFPSANIATSGISVPAAPVVIPTPPPPQLRFSTSSINPSINILASVATALYGPFMAARQAQPLINKGVPSISNNMQKPLSQGNILLPKNQNSHSHGRRTGEAGDSPFSPNSSDGDDLFEPPLEKRLSQSHKDMQSTSNSHKSEKNDRLSAPNPPNIGISASTSKPKSKSALFDSLFGSPSKNASSASATHQSKTHGTKSYSSSKIKKGNLKKETSKQLTEGELRQTEEVPTSAVELRVKEKFLKKLNRQERVVEEVKLALKPHYGKKIINKDEYKEILRRAVPKVCHTKSGEINPFKIKELVEAYVKKFKHSRGK